MFKGGMSCSRTPKHRRNKRHIKQPRDIPISDFKTSAGSGGEREREWRIFVTWQIFSHISSQPARS